MDLFAKDKKISEPPLADRMRPETFDDVLGQDSIVQTFKTIIENKGKILNSIFWGPPGSGKTTIARIIASSAGLEFNAFSAVTAGVNDVRATIKIARINPGSMILFADEVHRFNRAQQDAFLPWVENGTLIFIGATTENPSFEINSPLLSRCRVFKLEALDDKTITEIVKRSLTDKARGLGNFNIKLDHAALDLIVNLSNGDARAALNILEMAFYLAMPKDSERRLTVNIIKQAAQSRTKLYDKDREEHYNIISAFIKSLRGSDPDAALYWLARMLDAGEDPLFIARRLVIFASEDIGNADPPALSLAISTQQAVDFIGMPEGAIPLTQCTTYLASAPKSNASFSAYLKAKKDVENTKNEPVPLHLRNPVTPLMSNLGYGKGYKYPHDYKDAIVEQQFLPDNLRGKKYYSPKLAGFEEEIQKRLKSIRNKKSDQS